MTNDTVYEYATAALFFRDGQTYQQGIPGQRGLAKLQVLPKVDSPAAGQVLGEGGGDPTCQEHAVRNAIGVTRCLGELRVHMQGVAITAELGKRIDIRAREFAFDFAALAFLQFVKGKALGVVHGSLSTVAWGHSLAWAAGSRRGLSRG